MKLSPRYDDANLLRIDLPFTDPAVPMNRQRRRLAALLAELTDDDWARPSRCEGWSVQDVIAHLSSTNQFWTMSMASALAGQPTRFLEGFDPVASPEQQAASVRGQPSAAVLEKFIATSEALKAVSSNLSEEQWDLPGEAPPGHVPLRAVAFHALWDSWIHERDVALPLDLEQVIEDDEVSTALAYGSILGPGFTVIMGENRKGAVEVTPNDLDLRLVIDLDQGVRLHHGLAPDDALHLSGPAADLIDGLSYRIDMPCAVPADKAWLLEGLAKAFDH